MPTVPLSRIAHGRSGDKGNHANVAVIARTEAGYHWLLHNLTESRVRDYFHSLNPTRVERFAAPNLLAINFVLYDALAGGASESLRIDTQGKTYASVLLQMPVTIEDEALKSMMPIESRTEAKPIPEVETTGDTVRVQFDGPVALVKLNRPDKRNALSRELIQSLRETFRKLRDEDSVRCVILTGNGSAFCAGMDLDELRLSLHAEPEAIHQQALNLAHLYREIQTHPQPTICAVNGHAIAGGAGLVSVCDLALSIPEAKFGYPEVRRGLVAAMVLPHLLRHVGERVARYLLLTGELIDASEALGCGLINHVVPAELLIDTARQWAESIRQGGPNALRKTKELFDHVKKLDLESLARASAEPRFTDECQEGLKAFFGKDVPPWAR